MAKEVNVTRPHNLGKEEATARLGQLAGQLESKYGVKVDVTGDKASVKGKGVSGGCLVTDKDIRVNLSLGLPASMIAGKIEQGIHKAIDDHFTA